LRQNARASAHMQHENTFTWARGASLAHPRTDVTACISSKLAGDPGLGKLQAATTRPIAFRDK